MRSRELNGALATIAIVAVVAACSRTTEQTEKAAARAVTFNGDIAPILFVNCASCHRPIEDPPSPKAGSSLGAEAQRAKAADDPICVAGAPFSVLDYGSLCRHARALAARVPAPRTPP